MAPWIFRRTNPVASAAVVVVGSLVHLFLGPDMVPSMIMVVLTVQNLAHLAPMWASVSGFITALVGALLFAAKMAAVRSEERRVGKGGRCWWCGDHGESV